MVKKQLLYLFYIFCRFTLLVFGEKNILPNVTNSQEQESGFLAPWSWSRSRSKKIPGAGAAWGKNQEPEPDPIEKKAGAAKKFAGSQTLATQISPSIGFFFFLN